MTFQTTHLGAALGLLLASGAAADAPGVPQPTPKPKPRVYTNDDLDRIHPYAAQTGGSSAPAVPAAAEPDSAPGAPRSPARGEEYWRAEAARARARVSELAARAADLRRKIDEEIAKALRDRQNEVFGRRRGAPAASRGTASLHASLASVERRILKIQDDLDERARRGGALPGWLR